MPTYVYELLDKQGNPTGQTFETAHSMKQPALTKHPETGQPCRRAVVAPAIAGAMSPLSTSRLSNKNLERLGFTKYERRGDGYMERTAGKHGPRELHAD
jgi:predicted nucleic acid-binding Zn ribbon protein